MSKIILNAVCVYKMYGVCMKVTCSFLTFLCILLSSSFTYTTNNLNQWTSSVWKEKKLGGDTPYIKNPKFTPRSLCANKLENISTFYDWQKACKLLPQFKMQQLNPYSTVLTAHLFEKELDLFLETLKQQHAVLTWIDDKKLLQSCVDFQTYAEKLVIPATATVAIHGDMHGDIHAINRFIAVCAAHGFMNTEDPFKIKDENFYILFLGDYVDRGWYGAEVIYTIMRLKNANPDRVYMVRGNHEDVQLNEHYGFSKELAHKFASQKNLFSKIHHMYNLLPAVLYLGVKPQNKSDFVQCCHGGIEIGFDPTPLLEDAHARAGIVITDLMQKSMLATISCYELNPFNNYFHDMPISAINGFMWNDFNADPYKPFSLSVRDGYQGSMFDFSQLVTLTILRSWKGFTYQIRSIFRAHQQGYPEMRARILNTDGLSHPDDTGIGKLWIQNSIHQTIPSRLDNVAAITFSVAPDTGYGYPIHAFCFLKVAEKYFDWRLKVVRAPYKPNS